MDDKTIQSSDLEEIVIAVVDDDGDITENFYYDGFAYVADNIQTQHEPTKGIQALEDTTDYKIDIKDEPIEDNIFYVHDDILEKISNNILSEQVGSEQKNASSDILCTFCGKLINKKQLIKHMAIHETIKCNECSLKFKTQKELDKHKDVHSNNIYPCNKCAQRFKTAFEHSLHYFKHVKTYCCPICKFSTKSKSSIGGHIKRHEGQFSFHCTVCGKGFIGKALLTSHEEIHLDIKQYVCDVCGKKFSVKRYLDVHRQLNHKKELFGIEQHFQCDVCGREFTFEKSLRRHQSVIHQIGENRTVECPICHKIIANSYNLKIHMRIHTGEKNYCCDLCGKVFSAFKYWKKHKLIHDRKEEKNSSEDLDEIKIEDVQVLLDY